MSKSKYSDNYAADYAAIGTVLSALNSINLRHHRGNPHFRDVVKAGRTNALEMLTTLIDIQRREEERS